jgi:hypothetical protein
LDDVELGELGLFGEIGLLRIGDPNLAPPYRKNRGRLFLRHATRLHHGKADTK